VNNLDSSLGSAEPAEGERRARTQEFEEEIALVVTQPVSVAVQHFGKSMGIITTESMSTLPF